jgi:multiple sugar transport system substrate-binding protein
MMMRRIAISLIALFLLLTCPSCRSAKAPQPPVDEATVAAQKADAEQVNFITWNEDYVAALKKEVPEFEKRTGIKVTWTILSEDIVRDKVLVDLASGAGQYDLVLTDVWILPEHVASGYLEPLDSYARSDASFDASTWYPKFLEALTCDGHLYALPTESFGAAIVYRKDLFERMGVPVPQTVDELAAAARRLTLDTDRDGDIDVFGIVSRGKAGEEPAIVVSGFAWAYGGSWFENVASTAEEIRRTKAKPAFNSPQFIAGFKRYTDLLKNYGPPGVKDYTWYEIIEDGKKGKAALILNCGFNVGALDKESIGMRDKYYAALPVAGPKRHTQEAFAMGYGINKHSRHKEAAWQFLKFITGKEFMQHVMNGYATSLAVRAHMESDEYRKMHPYMTGSGDYVLEESIRLIDWSYMPRIPEYSVIANMLGRATSEVIAGKKDAKAAMDELNAAVYKLMKEAGYYDGEKKP